MPSARFTGLANLTLVSPRRFSAALLLFVFVLAEGVLDTRTHAHIARRGICVRQRDRQPHHHLRTAKDDNDGVTLKVTPDHRRPACHYTYTLMQSFILCSQTKTHRNTPETSAEAASRNSVVKMFTPRYHTTQLRSNDSTTRHARVCPTQPTRCPRCRSSRHPIRPLSPPRGAPT